MKERGVVALVTPREDRRRSATSWAPLFADRAELRVSASPDESMAREADLVLLDENCPALDSWIADALAVGENAASIVVFGDDEESRRGALPWGPDGARVLATLSDLLERRSMLHESDRFVEELRASTNRLDAHRRRFAALVLDQAEAMHASHASLTREVEVLRRLQSLARFFAAPGPANGFADRLAGVLAHALGASGLAIVRWGTAAPSIEGAHRISAKNALAQVPDAGAATKPRRGRSARKETSTVWLPLNTLPGWGVVLLTPESAPFPLEPLDAGARECLDLAAEGLATRLTAASAEERHLQNDGVLRALRGGLLKFDGKDRVRLANPAFASMVGVAPGALEGRPLADVFARDPHLVELFEGFRAGQALGDDVETFLTSAGGTTLSVAVRASIVIDESDGSSGILALFFDLSRRKEVEVEVRRAERLAALGRLSAGVAHEIRNPLAGIRTTAELLRSRLPKEDERSRFVDVILEESQRLDRIVVSLLQFAKPAEPRLEPFDLGALVDRTLQLASGKAAEHRVQLRRIPGKVVTPLADRDQILQVLLNLVLNAIEATPAGGEVSARIDGPAPGRAGASTVRVEDGGDGVSASIRERVFDPFFTTKPGGTGLGLSISEHIVRRHGGSIRLEKRGTEPHAAIVTLAQTLPTAGAPRGGSAWPAS